MIFSKNNIDFRQVSSNAQANFLKSKSFVLTEMTAKGSWQFSPTSKEFMLQTYKVWTTWLFEMEEYIVASGEKRITKDMIGHIADTIRVTNKVLTHHVRFTPDWYDERTVSIILEIRNLEIASLADNLPKKLLGKNLPSAYNEIVGTLIKYMNHLLFNLHEIDYLIYGDRTNFKPFLYIDNSDVELYLEEKEFFPSHRLHIYEKLGLMGGTKFMIKLGVSSKYLGDNTMVRDSYRDLLLNLKNCNANICCVV